MDDFKPVVCLDFPLARPALVGLSDRMRPPPFVFVPRPPLPVPGGGVTLRMILSHLPKNALEWLAP